jgi:hypothetical protein
MSAQAKRAPRRDYEVGYGKPPTHTRFEKGRSGNPSGRPRRSRWERAEEIALKEAYRPVTVRDGDKVTRVPAIQAVHRSQIALAAKGNGPAQRAVLRIIQKIERERHELNMELLKTAIDYQLNAARDLYQRQQLGITDIDPFLPHPDDVEINMSTGEVAIRHRDFPQGQPVTKRK